ncbi:MAG: helix-turn-helix domain-containing protein [Alphaproteobacteria bacterium]
MADLRRAAEYLGVNEGTLRNWRSEGCGPRIHLIQKRLVRYLISDLDAFLVPTIPEPRKKADASAEA